MRLTFTRNDINILLLILLTLTETLCCTYLLKSDLNTEMVAIGYFLAGLLIGTMPLISRRNYTGTVSADKRNSLINRWIIPACFLLLGVYVIKEVKLMIDTWPIDLHYADMLPQIQIMTQRFIDGQKIYAPIQEIWNGKPPPYLPLMWLPFTVAKWAHIDIRWTTIVFFLLGLFCLYKFFPKKFNGKPLLLLASFVSLFFLINFLLIKDRITFGHTEEGLVIAYYLFLAYALFKKQPVLIGIAIACCLMSRFSLFFWVPMYVLYMFFYESRRNAYIITGVVALIIFFVFLLPFGFWQPEYFLNIPADYQVGVDNAWRSNNNNGKYYQDFLGYARYFDISQINLLHYLQIGVAAVLPFLMLILFSITKKRIRFNTDFFGICTLKIVLVFFYNMVEVPYYYLFFVSTFFSYAILFMYMRQQNETSETVQAV